MPSNKNHQTQPATALSEANAARYLGMSHSWLRHARLYQSEHAPPHLRIGRAVRYRLADLDQFLEKNLVGRGGGKAA